MNAGFGRMQLVRAAIVVLAIACVGAFLFAWSGLYSVAASRGHWAIVECALAFVMQNSVETPRHAIEAPPLDDDDLIVLGAGAYHSGCAWCHGAPGIPPNPVTRGCCRAPPDLSQRLREWKDEELFWIVKHGIKYTGMPAWVSQRRDDEVWAVVAFLRRIQDLDAQGYRELALGLCRDRARAGATSRRRRTRWRRRSPASLSWRRRARPAQRSRPRAARPAGGFPDRRAWSLCRRERAERRHAAGRKRPDAGGHRAGRGYYASRPPRARKRAAAATPISRTDARSSKRAMPEAEFRPASPATATRRCRSIRVSPARTPRYMENQLRLWKTETTRHTEAAAIMAPIARALSDEQIADVAAYLESLPPGRGRRR